MTKTLSLHEQLTKAANSTLLMCFSFAILTGIAARIVIPATPVPFTLQTLAVMLSGALLGARKGFYAQLMYLAIGAAGFPVFAPVADGTYGVFSLFSPTGGYLLAFPLAAYLVGYLLRKNSGVLVTIAGLAAGEVLIITLGVLFLNTFYLHDLAVAINVGAGLFSIWTVAKIVTAAGITIGFKRLKK